MVTFPRLVYHMRDIVEYHLLSPRKLCKVLTVAPGSMLAREPRVKHRALTSSEFAAQLQPLEAATSLQDSIAPGEGKKDFVFILDWLSDLLAC